MKRIFLSFLVALVGCITCVQAQNVAKNLVVVEIATGTWCQFCPGSALGADDLVHNGHPVAIIENHNGDPYANASSNARNNMYPVGGYPSTFFDGQNVMSGGHRTNSIYSSYVPRVNAALANSSPYQLDMSFAKVNGAVTVTIEVEQVGATPGSNIVLHLAVTESHIPANWFGLSEINFVNRGFFPSSSGTPLNLSQGQKVTEMITFQMDPSWVGNNSEIVAFVQDMNTQEIFQGEKKSLRAPDFNLDAGVTQFATPISNTLCGDDVAPSILLRNEGGDTLRSIDIVYRVNGGPANAYNWTGKLGFDEEEAVNLPSVTFAALDTANKLNVQLSNPNGMTDENTSNDFIATKWDNPYFVKGNFFVIIFPDNKGSEITWDVKNDAGTVVSSGGPYTDGNTAQVLKPVSLGYVGCYEFNIYDAGGNGLSGNGFYEFRAPSGFVISKGSDYGAQGHAETGVTENTGIQQLLDPNTVSVFPNPSTGMFNVVLTDGQLKDINVSVFQLDGKQVVSKTGTATDVQVDLSGMAKGLYLLKVTTEEGVHTQKINLQ